MSKRNRESVQSITDTIAIDLLETTEHQRLTGRGKGIERQLRKERRASKGW